MLKPRLLKSMVNNVFLGFGSNIGNKKDNIIKALLILKNTANINLISFSSLYVTKAYGFTEQDDFLNLVCKVNTELSPFKLLEICKDIEKELGRVKTKKWGPRKIDVDILFYNNLVLNTGFLKIPHLDMIKRDFVLLPICEIDRNFIHPVYNISVGEIEEKIVERFIVTKIKFIEEEIV